MNFVFKMMNVVLKMMNFVLQDRREELIAAHLAEIAATKGRQAEFAEAKLDEFHEVLQKEMVGLTKLHAAEKVLREQTETSLAAEVTAKEAASVELSAQAVQLEATVQALADLQQTHEDERHALVSELETARQQSETAAADLQKRLEGLASEKRQAEEQHKALAATVATISDTFKSQNEATQSLHAAERQVLQSATAKAEEQIREIQSSSAETTQQQIDELAEQHNVAQLQLSEQHTAAAKIQAGHKRRVAQKDMRTVIGAAAERAASPVAAESIEALESELSARQEKHAEAVSVMETGYKQEVDEMAATCVASAAMAAAEERYATVDEYEEQTDAITAAYDMQMKQIQEIHEGERQEFVSELEAARQQEVERATELERRLQGLALEKQRVEEQHEALAATVATISDTFKSQSEATQSLHAAELEALQGATAKAEEQIREIQSSAAETTQQQMDELAEQHTAAQLRLSEQYKAAAAQLSNQHTAAAKIQAGHKRRVAQNNMRAVLGAAAERAADENAVAMLEGVDVALLDELENKLAAMQEKHTEKVALVEAETTEETVRVAATHSDAVGEVHQAAAKIQAGFRQQKSQRDLRTVVKAGQARVDAHETARQMLVSELEVSRQELEASRQKEVESAAEVQRLREELAVSQQQAEERHQVLTAAVQDLSDTFKAQSETAQSLHREVQSSTFEAAQAAIGRAAAEKSAALAALAELEKIARDRAQLQTEVDGMQSAHAEQLADQLADQMAELMAAETGWQVAVDASAAAASYQTLELKTQNQALLDEMLRTGSVNAVSIQTLQGDHVAMQAKQQKLAKIVGRMHAEATETVEAARSAENAHKQETVEMAALHASAIAERERMYAEECTVAEAGSEDAQSAEAAYKQELEEMRAAHTAELRNAAVETNEKRSEYADALSAATEQHEESALLAKQDHEAELVAGLIVSSAAYEAVEQNVTQKNLEIDVLCVEAEALRASHDEALLAAEAANTSLSEQHTAAARIQVQHHRRVAQRDMRAVMGAQRDQTATEGMLTDIAADESAMEDMERQLAAMQAKHAEEVVVAETVNTEEMVKVAATHSDAVGEVHQAASKIQAGFRQRKSQRDLQTVMKAGHARVTAVQEAGASLEELEALGAAHWEQMHSARTDHAEALQALQRECEALLNDQMEELAAEYEIKQFEAAMEVQEEKALLSARLAEAEEEAAAAERQLDAAFVFNQHSSAASLIQGFAKRRQQKIATRALLSQSSQRSGQVDAEHAALNDAVASSSERLEGAVRQTQALLSDALAREAQTAKLLEEERRQRAALQQETAEKQSELLAAHTAAQTNLGGEHTAAATIQRGFRQKNAQQDLHAVVKTSQARLKQKQDQIGEKEAALEEVRDELHHVSAMGESALEQLTSSEMQLALEIRNGRDRAAATKIQVRARAAFVSHSLHTCN